jgi:hypothetical protein
VFIFSGYAGKNKHSKNIFRIDTSRETLRKPLADFLHTENSSGSKAAPSSVVEEKGAWSRMKRGVRGNRHV